MSPGVPDWEKAHVTLEYSRRWALRSTSFLCTGDRAPPALRLLDLCVCRALRQRQGYDRNTCITVRAVIRAVTEPVSRAWVAL